MADSTSSIPPSSSSRIVTSDTSNTSSPNQVTPSNSSETLNLLIKHAPANLKDAKTPQTLEGKVIYSNPQAEEMRVKIGENEIILKTALNLPHNTKIIIKIYQQNNQLMANISVIGEDNLPFTPSIDTQNAVETPAIINNANFTSVFPGQKLNAILTPNAKTEAIDHLLTIIFNIDKNKFKTANFGADDLGIESVLFSDNPNEILNKFSKQKIDIITEAIKNIFNIKTHTHQTNFDGHIKQAYTPTRKDYEGGKNQQGQDQNFMPEDTGDDLLQILGSSLSVNRRTENIGKAIPTSQIISGMTTENLELIQGGNNPTNSNPHYSLTDYRIDVLEIITDDVGLPDIVKYIKNLHERVGDHQTPEYRSLPIKMAEVQDVTHDGFPIIKALTIDLDNPYGEKDEELFIIKQHVKLEKGDIILFKAVPVPNMVMQSKNIILDVAQLITEEFEPFSDSKWPALDDAIKVLNNLAPQLAQNISNSIPSPTQNFPSTALLFLAALRFGSIEGWLGANTLQLLKSSEKENLVSTLKNNFGRIVNLSKEENLGQWKIISMPMLYEGKLEQIKLYTHHEYEGQEGDKKEKHIKSMRFIFNIELSRMGKMQLDGAINKPKKLLNIALRSVENLSSNMRNDISTLFINSLEQMGMKGEITFHSGKIAMIKLEEIALENDSLPNNFIV